MELRPSKRNKNLLVSKCGKLFYEHNMQPLVLSQIHGLSTRGVAATYRDFKSRKTRMISVGTEVLETWILERKSTRGEFVYYRDGDETNCHADNITLKGSPGRFRSEPIPHEDRYSIHLWNGHDAIYC